MFLHATRYDQIKHEVLFMYEECEVVSYPIDCYEIAQKLCYILVPYSSLTDHQLRLAMEFSSDGFSVLRKMPDTGMYRWFIFYNDFNNKQRQRWTIFHEIGHIYLGHFECDDLSDEEKEAEANFFAKYSIAPPPLVNIAKCECPWDVAVVFDVSGEASMYLYSYYQKWMQYGPREYEPFELQMIEMFQAA